MLLAALNYELLAVNTNGPMEKCCDYQGVLIIKWPKCVNSLTTRSKFISTSFPVHRLHQLIANAYVFIMYFIF